MSDVARPNATEAVAPGVIKQTVGDRWPDEVLALAGSVPDFPLVYELRSIEGVDATRAL